MTHDNLSASDSVSDYDPERYDIDTHPDECLECGASFSVRQVAGGASKACPDCGVLVWVM